LLESILDRAQSKAYPHAARYLRRLGTLAKKIPAFTLSRYRITAPLRCRSYHHLA
jgi:hypothetical protein